MEKSASLAYRVKSSLGADRISVIATPGVQHQLHVATPPEFPNGIAGVWSPETLLLSAVAGCYVNTFLALANKFDFKTSALACEAVGTVAVVEGKYAFTNIRLYPTLTLSEEQDEVVALNILEKAHRYCLVSNTLRCPVEMHEKILLPAAA